MGYMTQVKYILHKLAVGACMNTAKIVSFAQKYRWVLLNHITNNHASLVNMWASNLLNNITIKI